MQADGKVYAQEQIAGIICKAQDTGPRFGCKHKAQMQAKMQAEGQGACTGISDRYNMQGKDTGPRFRFKHETQMQTQFNPKNYNI